MASKKIQKIVDKFVADIVSAAEDEAMEMIQARLGDALSGRVATGVKRRKSSKKGKSILRPCPIKGCKGTAAPRYQMVCKKHNEACTREEIVIARDIAERPGGIWYEAKSGKKKSA
jgi:hypothetical protein